MELMKRLEERRCLFQRPNKEAREDFFFKKGQREEDRRFWDDGVDVKGQQAAKEAAL